VKLVEKGLIEHGYLEAEYRVFVVSICSEVFGRWFESTGELDTLCFRNKVGRTEYHICSKKMNIHRECEESLKLDVFNPSKLLLSSHVQKRHASKPIRF